MNTKRSFMHTNKFVWMIAPSIGAVLALAGFGGWRVVASSRATKVPFCLHGYFYPSGFWKRDGQIPR